MRASTFRARRTDQQQRMRAGGRNFEHALGLRLSRTSAMSGPDTAAPASGTACASGALPVRRAHTASSEGAPNIVGSRRPPLRQPTRQARRTRDRRLARNAPSPARRVPGAGRGQREFAGQFVLRELVRRDLTVAARMPSAIASRTPGLLANVEGARLTVTLRAGNSNASSAARRERGRGPRAPRRPASDDSDAGQPAGDVHLEGDSRRTTPASDRVCTIAPTGRPLEHRWPERVRSRRRRRSVRGYRGNETRLGSATRTSSRSSFSRVLASTRACVSNSSCVTRSRRASRPCNMALTFFSMSAAGPSFIALPMRATSSSRVSALKGCMGDLVE